MTDTFGEVVIGAGMAGLCCAGELVVQGRNPLLICETQEVGSVFAATRVGDSARVSLQHPLWQLGCGGGWWYQLARDLDIPLRLYQGLSINATVLGSGKLIDLPLCPTASAIADAFGDGFSLPAGTKRSLHAVLSAGLAIPYEDMFSLDRVPFGEWLEKNGADELAAGLLLAFCGGPNLLNLAEARDHLSVMGGLATLRGFLCGEAVLPLVKPDTRAGLCVPLAEAIERRGGQVWRGRRVDRIVIEDDAVCGVVWAWPFHAAAPWTVEEGKQLLVSMRGCSAEEAARLGGREAIYDHMHEVNEELYPGYGDAIGAVATQSHKHHWMSPMSTQPKLPRSVDSVPASGSSETARRRVVASGPRRRPAAECSALAKCSGPGRKRRHSTMAA